MNKLFVSSDEAVADALALLDPKDILSGDTETDGLSPYMNQLWSVQLGDRDTSILFPYHALSEPSRKLLREYMRTRTVIFHNAKFDSKFLFINGFDLKSTYCTQEVERTLFAGKYFTFGLKDVLLRRFQIQMDKEAREIFYSSNPREKSEFQKRVDELGPWKAWNEELIEYALEDIAYLHEIYDGQQEDAKQLGMSNILYLENKLVPVVGRMENRGVNLDIPETKKFQGRVTKLRDKQKQNIFGLLEKNYNISWRREYADRMKLWDSWKSSHEKIVAESNKLRVEGDRRKKSPEGLKMVENSLKRQPFSTKPKEDNPFSASSPVKLQQALTETVGFPVTTTGKEWLEENIHLHEAIAGLVEFRKYEKLCQFCELMEDINEKTGLIHADFHQNGTKSGRFSCSNPNLQQIPAKSDEAKEFRALFRPREGYKFLGADYAGIELVIIAYFSGEQILIDAINRDDDVHCFTMSLFLGTGYEALVKAKKELELSVEEIYALADARKRFEQSFSMPELAKKTNINDWVKALRDYTKTLTYGLAYGLSEFGLSRKFHCSYEDAQLFILRFFDNYPNLKKFLSIQEELGFERKYAVNPLGRRRWFFAPKPKSYEAIESEVIKKLDKQKRLWDSVTDEEWEGLMAAAIKDAEKEYKSRINGIKRQAGNFFPQSMCADMIKLAMVRFDTRMIAAGLKDDEGLWATIHDELQVVVKDENVEKASEILKEAMLYGVHKFMPDIKIKIDVTVSDRWVK
jgi:DNA polymerase I-like protein with 3'-5' exonuclease and polymerase domains